MKLPMKEDLVRIDWNKAEKEAEQFMELECSSNNHHKIDSMDASIYAVGLLCDIKRMHQNDDTVGYLNLLDKNKSYLKEVTV